MHLHRVHCRGAKFGLSVHRCLIVVSVHGSNDYSTLTSRSVPSRCLWRGRPQDGTPVFDRLEYPSFVEFDDVNSKVLSYNAVTR